MKRYNCPRCGLETDFKHDFLQHLQRKNICKPLLADVELSTVLEEINKKYQEKPRECEFCKKRFANHSSLSVHRKTCKSRPSSSSSGNVAINGNNNSVLNNSVVINNFNNIHFHLNPVEYAETSFIPDNVLQKLVEFVSRPGQVDIALTNLVKLIYFNKKHPENYGIYIPNKKKNEALVWDGAAWNIQPIKDAVKVLRNKAYCLIADFFDEKSYSFKMMTQQEWNAFINRQKAGDPKLFKVTDKNIRSALQENSQQVKIFIKGKVLVSHSNLWKR